MPSRRSSLLPTLLATFALTTISPLFAQDEEPLAVPEGDQVLASEPTTVPELFEGALLTVKLARPELAKIYLGRILQLNPDDSQLLALRDKNGMSALLSLARLDQVNPEASELLSRVTEAAKTQVGNPEYATDLIKLLNGTARDRDEATTQLQLLGQYAVAPLLKAIVDSPEQRETLVLTLARLGQPAIDPLVGALQSPIDEVKTTAAQVLGAIGGEDEVIWLLEPAFSPNSPPGTQAVARKAIARIRYKDPSKTSRVTSYGAAEKLQKTSLDYLANQFDWPPKYEEMNDIPVWTWSDDEQTVVENVTSRRNASTYFAERLARDSAELAPSSDESAELILAAMMVRDIEEAGWDQPIPTGPGTAHDIAVEAGPEFCSQVLKLSLDNQIVGSALSSAHALGLNGSRNQLRGATSPAIVEALNSAHPRVQLAAAITILQWEPNQSFRGSSRIVPILGRAIQSDDRPQSVVIDPNGQRGTTTAAIFQELGYRGSVAETGQEGFRIAAERGDIELGIVHPSTIRWGLTQTLTNLRADARTRDLPLVVYGPRSIRSRFDLLQDEFQNVVYIDEGTSPVEINKALQPVLAQISPPPLTPAQRSNQIREASYWLRRIASTGLSDIFDLAPIEEEIRLATSNPVAADNAVVALGGIGLPSAQLHLFEIMESPNMDMKLRQQAGFQLAFHVQRFGNLLKPDVLRRLQALSGNTNDGDLETAIASVLGSLHPDEQRSRKLILSTPPSTQPVTEPTKL
ncbi:HEAT repeat domain-containing protein [Thalassoglobus sp. JC818]|uniref:HEAT repeat domain-containing protein n=1 Tax=Thalassoglobus sp. JC818 TaxID=3232136 RepID=UPI003457A3A1